MPRKSERDRIADWKRRLESAEKVYKQWEEKFVCSKLYDYYEGFQWPVENKANYVINLVFPTVEAQLSAQRYNHPRVLVKARPGKRDESGSQAEERAQLQEDTLNTFITDPQIGFKQAVDEAWLESFFYFGVVEVGYTADFIDNPNAGKPVLKEKSDEAQVGEDGNPVLEQELVLDREWLYVKYVPADTFRVGINGRPRLDHCDWCGYYEWFYPADLKRNRRYKNNTDVRATGRLKDAVMGDASTENDPNRDGMVKVWKIWDIRGGKRLDFAEGNDNFLLEENLDRWENGQPVIPFAVHARHKRRKEFYPLPPIFNWISPQDQLNQYSDLIAKILRKLVPKFYARPNVPQAEIDKFIENVIQVIRTNNPDDVGPINVPQSDAALLRNIPRVKEDFREISGTSGEDRGVVEAETATQASIIDLKGRIRESKSKDLVADWLADIARLMLYFLRYRMQLPYWIKRNADMNSPGSAMEVLRLLPILQQILPPEALAGLPQEQDQWQQIVPNVLGDLNCEVTVDVESVTALTEASERQDWLNALGVISTAGPLMSSDVILRKTMAYFGVRSEKELAAIRQVIMVMMLAQAAAATQAPQGKPKGQAGAQGPGPTPNNAEIQGQLDAQMGTQQVV